MSEQSNQTNAQSSDLERKVSGMVPVPSGGNFYYKLYETLTQDDEARLTASDPGWRARYDPPSSTSAR